jgi:hypothetical protein
LMVDMFGGIFPNVIRALESPRVGITGVKKLVEKLLVAPDDERVFCCAAAGTTRTRPARYRGA